MLDIPAVATDFTVDWMNAALTESGRLDNNQVIDCKAIESEIPGQTAEIVLLTLTYKNPATSLPDRMVAKITSRNPIVLEQVIANYDQYRRETSFYREFQDCGIAVPDCLYEQHDPVNQQMVILMADLAPAICPSWAITPDQVTLALDALPTFHGKWWNQSRLRVTDWFVQPDNKAFFHAAFSAADAGASALEKYYEAPAYTEDVMAFLANNLDIMLAYFASRPFTFVHGDYHAKQMFFPARDGGQFAVIDWQFPFVAQGAWDFARMLGMCMATEERHQRERALLDQYHAGLQQVGVRDYSPEALEDDYRIGLAISQMIMAIAAADTDPAIFEKECGTLGLDWRDVMFNRNQTAMQDWDVLGFLRRLKGFRQ